MAEFKRRLDFNMGRVRNSRPSWLILMHAVHSDTAAPGLSARAATALLLRAAARQWDYPTVNAQITVAKGATSNSQHASVPTMKPDICAAQLAPGVRRESRITRPPRRPKDGWTLVVQPLSRRRNKVGGLCATLLFAVS